jgi:CubicO group peptidase (beta-lactamase class C family)
MTRSVYLFYFVAILLFSGCTAPKTEETQSDASTFVNNSVKARIDSTLKSFVDSGKVAGVSALIFENNKETYFNSFGFSDVEAQTPFDRNTIVRIYSMTKPVTGVALMQLHEKGLFQLDDPISKYAPEFSDMKVYSGTDASGKLMFEAPHRPITIRDITRHTAGFADQQHPQLGKLVQDAKVMDPQNTLVQMAEKLSKLPLSFHPGEKWSYGISVDVQAYLVERISGKPFDQYVKENILDPLKMNETRYVVPAEDQNRFSVLYARGEDGNLQKMDNEFSNFNNKDWPLKPGGFGLTSTIDDYMKFAQMLVNEGTLDNNTVLKEETVKLMATNHLADSVTDRMWLPSKGSVGFGIDFAVRSTPPQSPEENHGIVGEFFWDGAASTLFWVDPKNELTAVLFVQIFPFNRELHKKFRDALYGVYKPNDVVSK